MIASRKACAIFILTAVCVVTAAVAADLVVYTSMKEPLVKRLDAAFEKAHPGIVMDYYIAGAGKLMQEIESELAEGGIQTDVLWTSEVPDFFRLRDQGLLERYKTPELPHIVNPFGDLYDGSFTAVRLGTLGIAYNTSLLPQPPKTWEELTTAKYKNAFALADPASSGTAYMGVLLLVDRFGWEYIEALGRNGAGVEQGSGMVIDETATESYSACLAVDYSTFDKIKKGAPLGIAYPPEMLVLPSPVAIFKDSRHMEMAKKFVDFLLSPEAQEVIAGEGTIPVRRDVVIPPGFGLPSPTDAGERAIPIDYTNLPPDKKAVLARFNAAMGR